MCVFYEHISLLSPILWRVMEWKIKSNKLLLFWGIVEKGTVKFFKKYIFWKKTYRKFWYIIELWKSSVLIQSVFPVPWVAANPW